MTILITWTLKTLLHSVECGIFQYKKDNLAGEYWNMPHSTECKRIADTPFGKMFFLIAGIYNKNSHGICGPYYYSEYFDDELKFARDVYKLLSI